MVGFLFLLPCRVESLRQSTSQQVYSVAHQLVRYKTENSLWGGWPGKQGAQRPGIRPRGIRDTLQGRGRSRGRRHGLHSEEERGRAPGSLLPEAGSHGGRAGRKATASSWAVGDIQGLQELPGGRMGSSSGAGRMETGPSQACRVAPLC